MEAAQMVMMPAVPQDSGMQALDETLPQSGGLSGEQFASLLGNALAGGSISKPAEIDTPPEVTIETADPTVLLSSDAQQNAQLMAASYLQAAMMVPVLPVAAETPVVSDPGVQGVGQVEAFNATTVDPVLDQILSAQDLPEDLLTELQNQPQTVSSIPEAPKDARAFSLNQKQQEGAAVEPTSRQLDEAIMADADVLAAAKAAVNQQEVSNAVQSANMQKAKIAASAIQQEVGKEQQLQSETRSSVNELTEAGRKTVTSVDLQQASTEEAAVMPEMTNLQKNTTVNQQVKFATQPGVELAAADASQNRRDSAQSGHQQNTDSANSGLSAPIKEILASDAELILPEQPFSAELQNHKQDIGINGMHLNRQTSSAEAPTTANTITQSVPAENIARQVSDKISSFEVKPGNNQISLSLSPENLGNLQMNVKMEDQRIRIDIVAENRGVRDALLQQADELKETLARQNIKMDSFNVTTGNNGNMYQQPGDWRQAAAERQAKISSYGSQTKNASAVATVGMQTRYFAPQYQSTLDVRF